MTAAPPHALAFPTVQIWAFAASWFVPLVTYVVNRAIRSEAVSGFVLAIAAAISAGVVQAIDTGGVGFNQVTLQLVITAVGGALLAHHAFWKPTGISHKLRLPQEAAPVPRT